MERYKEFQGLLSQWVGHVSLLLPAFVSPLTPWFYCNIPPQVIGTQIFGGCGLRTAGLVGTTCLPPPHLGLLSILPKRMIKINKQLTSQKHKQKKTRY